MKIFYLITKSETGGAQTHIYQLSKYFIEKGNKVAVMAYPGGWLEKETGKLGVRFYPNYYLSNKPNPISILKAMREVKKSVKDFKPDLVSCHSTAAGFLGRVTIKNRIPTTFTAHGWAFSQGTPFFRKCLAILVEKLAGKFCSEIICVSDFDRRLALKHKIIPPDKLTVIYNGVEIQPVEAECPLEVRPREVRIVFVGRLGKQKEPLLLLESFNNLSSDLREQSQIFIIGEGPKRKKLEKFIKANKLEGKVRLLGSIPREKVFEILKKSAIFVLVSNWEGFPYTIIEAMSCGLAIIASDVGGVREAVSARCGFLIKRGDEEGLKRGLAALLKNPELIQEMGRVARRRAAREFSLEKMLERTNQIYYSLLKNS